MIESFQATKGLCRNRSRWVRRSIASVRRRRRTKFGSRRMASASESGRTAAMSNGQRMLVSFHGSHDIARLLADGREPLWGGKLGRDGGHPVEHGAEQYLGVEPSERGVVTVVGQDVEAAERLPAFELQLDLPTYRPGLQSHFGIEPDGRHGGEER